MSNQITGWGKKPTQSTATPKLKDAVKSGKNKKLTFELDETLHQKFKIYATQQSSTMGELLNTYIQQLVNT